MLCCIVGSCIMSEHLTKSLAGPFVSVGADSTLGKAQLPDCR